MTPPRTQQVVALDALDDHAQGVAERIRALLESGAPEPAEPDALAATLAAACEDIHSALLGRADRDPAGAATLCETLAELTALRGELSEHVVELRFRTLAGIHDALARLRERPTVADLLSAAVQELCRSCHFDRAVISRVQGAQWRPEVVYFDPGHDPRVAKATRDFLLSGEGLPLSTGMLETQLMRRRTAAVVTDPLGDPRIHQELVRSSQTPGYVVAPIMPTGRVIGFLHADCHDSRRELGTLDRDNLWTFAEGFGLIYERLVLFERLREQRERARAAFGAAERQIDALSDAEVELARHEQRTGTAASTAAAMFSAPGPGRVERLLTEREREVMALMVGGARNREIADRLVITPETVKSHVKKIRRKLRASNRADAVSRYLQLTMQGR